jgi:hypothetical protein
VKQIWPHGLANWLRMGVQAIAQRVGVTVSPSVLASPVVNYKALDVVSADYRKAAADTMNRSTEGEQRHVSTAHISTLEMAGQRELPSGQDVVLATSRA